MDPILFEFLHMEAVHSLVGRPAIVPPAGGEPEVDVTKLELVGFRTGQKFVEKLTKDYAPFKDELDIVKFICKEYWSALFGKQIDNLRTNHQGVYVLLDQRFKFISRISNSRQFSEHIPRYLTFTCGMTRGALASLGVETIVTAELLMSPAVKFQIQLVKQLKTEQTS